MPTAHPNSSRTGSAEASAQAGATPAVLPRLRVRIERGYAGQFFMDLGQRNAVFVKRPLVPLRRLFSWADAFALLPEPDFDMIHSFNAIPILTRRPYIVTYEDYLPRVPEDRYIGWLERRLRNSLLEDRCVAVVAASEYARRQFHWQHRDWTGRAAVEQKTHRIYPAVPVTRTQPKQPSPSRLKLVFVGGDFMRKGGPAVLRTHERLARQGVPVE
ncbi:MAG: glycosyl transferase family 1, partial [Candidatus Omnitrophica bacterium]|nr:glycosyl transferase family 1 [Candidatus Omnitrophota bacterium]